ncbi:MAG: GNAT family N-acetyltransferase [Actinomycetota bacterium]
MARSPTLTTARLTLVRFTEGLVGERYIGWLNDPRVTRYSRQRHRRHDREDCLRFLAGYGDGSPSHFWAILAGGEHVGNITADVDLPNRVAALSIMIGEVSAWGKGIGAEAWGAVADVLLADGGMRKLEAGTMAVNLGMLKVFERTGFAVEGIRPRHFLWEGQEVDLVQAGRFRH